MRLLAQGFFNVGGGGLAQIASTCTGIYYMHLQMLNYRYICYEEGIMRLTNFENQKWLLISIVSISAYRRKNWWNGANDLDVEGSWVWADVGGSVDSSFWAPREPDKGRTENCASFSDMFDFEMADYRCSNQHPFICEYEFDWSYPDV